MKLPELSYRARLIGITLVICAVFDVLIWNSILASLTKSTKLYFLDVGQGDSQLIVLPGNTLGAPIKILSDAGPDGTVVTRLAKILPPTDRYIDLLVLSHPQADHFNGFIEVMKQYEVGALLFNGREGTAQSWQEFESVVKEKHIPVIIAGEGDSVSYASNTLQFLAPNATDLKSKELNDTMVVGLLTSNNAKALFTGDIGEKIEAELVKKYNLDIDVLKVGHHGSKTSSSNLFLAATTPKVAVIQVGAKNHYGHPTKEALARLAASGARIYRNDKNGTIEVDIDGAYLDVKKEK